MGAHASVQRDAATARAMGVEQWRNLGRDPGLRQRLDHDVALPRLVGLLVPVLDRAAAADAEMRTERRDALGLCCVTRSSRRRSG